MSRAQAELIGITLLIGFVLVSAGALLVVGSSVLSPLEAQSEQEQNIDEMESVAHEIDTMMRTGQADGEVGLEGDYAITDGATITFIVDGDGENAETIETGQLEHEGLIYQGGLVVHDDDDGQVISSPSLELTDRSSHLHIPKLDPDADSFDGALSNNGTSADIDAPEEELEIVIESKYYQEWADEFDNADSVKADDGLATVKYEINRSPATPNALSMGGEGTNFQLNNMPGAEIYSYDGHPEDEKRPYATVSSYIDDSNLGGGNSEFDIYGWFQYDEEGEEPNTASSNLNIYEDFDEEDERDPESTEMEDHIPTEDYLLEIDGTDYDGSGNLDGGVFSADEDLSLEDDVTATDESILIVDGDLTVEEGVSLTNDAALDVHVHGDLILEDSSAVMSEEYEADRTSIFVADTIESNGDGGSGPTVTGLLYATEAELDITGTFTNNGAIVVDQLSADDQNNDFINLRYDEHLEDRQTPYATDLSGETVSVPEPVVDTENFEAKYEEDGPYRIEDNKKGNVEIDGDLEGIEEREVDGNLLVDGDITNELDEAEITGDLLVTGEVEDELDDVEIGGDLRIAGDLDDEIDETDVGGDLVIGGDVDDGGLDEAEIGGDLRIKGDLHDELDEVEVNQDLIIHGDVSDELDEADIGRHLVIGGDLSDELDEIEVTGDVFVGGAVTDEIDEAEIDGDLTVWGGIDDEVDEVEIGGDLMVDGDVKELDEGEMSDIYVSGKINEIDDTDYENKYTGEDVDTDDFPTINDYLENYTIEYEIQDMTADHHTPAHDFDIRITEIEAE